jgi:hypothetical protein
MPKRKLRIVKRAGTSRCAEYVNIAMPSSRLPHIASAKFHCFFTAGA